MNKILTLIFFIISITNVIYSQDSLIKYLPLHAGNEWVYNRTQTSNFPPGPGLDVVKIEGSFAANNHVYYILKSYIYYESGQNRDTISKNVRIDSITNNIYEKLISGECLDDSLKAKMLDSAYCTCVGRSMKCTDTNTYSVFGSNVRSKTFNYFIFESGLTRTYAKNFGMVHSIETVAPSHTTVRTLRGCIIDGVIYGDTSTLVGINPISSQIPDNFSLSQNYPNPFNPATNIKFTIPQKSFVTIAVYNVLGEEVTRLLNEELSPGTYETNWDAGNYPSGVYYYKLVARQAGSTTGDNTNNGGGGNFTETKKMVLIK